MVQDKECGFAVWFKFPNGNSEVVFVMAERVGDAIRKAHEKRSYLRDTPAFAVEAVVVDADMLKDVLPDMKKVARQYWNLALATTDAVVVTSSDVFNEEFEATWKDHGIDASE